jgi:hypothetical protein
VILVIISCMYVFMLSLFIVVKFICEFFRKRALSEVACLACWWLGTLQIGIRAKRCLLSDDARPVGAWGRYKMVSEGFLE